VRTTLFPITMQGRRLGVRLDPPKISEHMRELLRDVGYAADAIDALVAQGAVAENDAAENHPAEGAKTRDERLEQAAITASP
jgi:hypothetical protein